MEIYELSDKEFKITVEEKLTELPENMDNSMKSGKQYMGKIRNEAKKSKS